MSSTWAMAGFDGYSSSQEPPVRVVHRCGHHSASPAGLDRDHQCRQCGTRGITATYRPQHCDGCGQILFYPLGARRPAWPCNGDRQHTPPEDFAEAA